MLIAFSHYSAQYADGAIGPIVIHGPEHVEYDYDLGPVMLTDYYHRAYLSNVADAVGTSDNFNVYVPPSDNNLINGKPSYEYLCGESSRPCNRTDLPPVETHHGLAHFRLRSGKIHRLRLVNTGAAAFQYFSIDEHELEVIANDFVPLQPYKTSVVSLGIGQRADVLVHANIDSMSSYWMRASVGTNCSRGSVNETKAIVHYGQAESAPIPSSRPHRIPGIHALCKNVRRRSIEPFLIRD
jgi:FtsP/CotA-like multicopper oxidase with cupredoxin domain